MAPDAVVIVSAVRSPFDHFLDALAPIFVTALGSHVIRSARKRAQRAPDRPDEVLIGCVLPEGQGEAPARQPAGGAGLPNAIGATTINKGSIVACRSARGAGR
jgi:acetyl-CoA C-acetyltransferase